MLFKRLQTMIGVYNLFQVRTKVKFNKILYILWLHVTSLGKNLKRVGRVCRNARSNFFQFIFLCKIKVINSKINDVLYVNT